MADQHKRKWRRSLLVLCLFLGAEWLFAGSTWSYDQGHLDKFKRDHSCFVYGGCDLSGADLSGLDLSGADLLFVNLSGANLSSANLTGAYLYNANLSNATLSGANLSGANLSGANLVVANLSGANLSGANLSGANLSNATGIESANFAGVTWTDGLKCLNDSPLGVCGRFSKKDMETLLNTKQCPNCYLEGADLNWKDLTGADLKGSWLKGAILYSANLSSANLTAAYLRSANLSSAKLTGANLSNADLTGSKFDRADMTRADLTGAGADSASFYATWLPSAKLIRGNFSSADLTGANLYAANLTEANLSWTKLSWADLHEACLEKASLRSATAYNANFIRANLRKATLSGVNLTGSDLTYADLSEAVAVGTYTIPGAGSGYCHTVMAWTHLYMANLSGMKLYQVDLTRADLRGANLTGTVLSKSLYINPDIIVDGECVNPHNSDGSIQCEILSANLTDAWLGGATWTDGATCSEASVGECYKIAVAPPASSTITVNSLTPELNLPGESTPASIKRMGLALTPSAELIFKARYFVLYEGEKPLLVIETKGLTGKVSDGVLKYGTTYKYYVLDLSTTNEPIKLVGPIGFTTPGKPAGEDNYGNALIGQGLRDAKGKPIALADTTLKTLLTAGAGLLPQQDMLSKIQNNGGKIIDGGGNTLMSMNLNDVRVVRSLGGQGMDIVMAPSDANLLATTKPLTTQGYSMDVNGNLKPDVAVPSSNINFPLGLFDFTVSLATHTDRAQVIIVPASPFTLDTKWYKILSDGTIKEYPNFVIDASGNGILTLYDNDEWDKNPAFGIIRDPGGPGTPTGGGGGCFIATAAYGSYLHPFVYILRTFRDTVLLASSFGSSFVEWYYQVSPPIAEVIAHNSTLSAGVRIMLLPVIGLAWLCLKAGVAPTAFMLLLFCAFIAIVIRSVRRRSAHPAS